ncbi:MAG: PP2C family protein-serine/threonine phosphatase, partial [Actinomycetota bacterium]
AARAAAVGGRQPARVLHLLNEALRHHDTDRFCTAVYGRAQIRESSTTLTVASAGHPLPLLVTPGQSPRAIGRPGTLLGVLPELDVTDVAVELHPGDSVILFSDGVTEGRQNGDFFGEVRLLGAASPVAASASELAHGVVDAVVDFQGGMPSDDIAVVVLRVPQ